MKGYMKQRNDLCRQSATPNKPQHIPHLGLSHNHFLFAGFMYISGALSEHSSACTSLHDQHCWSDEN